VSVTEERVVTDSEWTDKRMDDFVDRVGRFEGDVKERFDKVDAQFEKVDARFDKVDARFDKVDARFHRVDDRFDRLEAKIDTTNRTIWASIFAAVMVKILFG
jgi:archaellum component FlaC